MKNKTETYYTARYSAEEIAEFKRNKQKQTRKDIIVVTVIILGIVLYAIWLKSNVFNEQYAWSTELVQAIEEGDTEKAKLLLTDEDKDVNEPGGGLFPYSYFVEVSSTRPLVEACFRGNYEIVKLLIERGADPTLDAGTPFDPLYNTLDEYNINTYRIVKLLLEHGADPDEIVEFGEEPLYLVAQMAQTDYIVDFEGTDTLSISERGENIVQVFKLIREYSKNKYPEPTEGPTLLMCAVKEENIALVRYLLENPSATFDVNEKDKYGRTALFFLKWKSDSSPKIAEVLLSYGADKTIENMYGSTIYDYAVINHDEGLMELLKP